MTKTTSRHFLDILAKVPDFRNNRGKRHPLSAILGLAVIAMMCGCRSYAAIAEWGRTYHSDLPKALGFRRTKTPCASTFHYVFKDLDAIALENTLTDWALTVLEGLSPETDTQALAIDGKTLCGSDKQGCNDQTPLVCRLSPTRNHSHTTTCQCQNKRDTNRNTDTSGSRCLWEDRHNRRAPDTKGVLSNTP